MILQSKLIKGDLTWSLSMRRYKNLSRVQWLFLGVWRHCSLYTWNWCPGDCVPQARGTPLPAQWPVLRTLFRSLSCWPCLLPGVTWLTCRIRVFLPYWTLPPILGLQLGTSWESLLLWPTLLGPKREDVLSRALPGTLLAHYCYHRTRLWLLGSWKQLPWKDVSPGPKPINRFLWVVWMNAIGWCLQQSDFGVVWVLC